MHAGLGFVGERVFASSTTPVRGIGEPIDQLHLVRFITGGACRRTLTEERAAHGEVQRCIKYAPDVHSPLRLG